MIRIIVKTLYLFSYYSILDSVNALDRIEKPLHWYISLLWTHIMWSYAVQKNVNCKDPNYTELNPIDWKGISFSVIHL